MDVMQQSKQLRLYFEETLEVPVSSSSEMSIAADYSQRLAENQQLLEMILERDEIPGLLSILIGELKNEEAVLRSRLAETSDDLREIPIRSIEESRLRREVASAERLFTQIQGRYETARLAAASTIPEQRKTNRVDSKMIFFNIR